MKNKVFQKVVVAGMGFVLFSANTLGVTFSDVPTTNTFATYIYKLADAGVVSGYSDGTFKPDQEVTRAQMSKFIFNAFKFTPDTSCAKFSDVTETNNFYTQIMTLKCRGVISGYSDGTFKPEGVVNRGAAMKFVVQAILSSGNTTPPPASNYTQKFSDVPTSHSFFLYIMMGEEAKIVSGFSDGTYKPDQSVTRGAMSKMVSNAVDLIGGIGSGTAGTVAEARNAIRTADVNIIANAIKMYMLDGKQLPGKSQTPVDICVYQTPSCGAYARLDYLVPTYLPSLPNDPQYTSGITSGYKVMWGSNDSVTVSAPMAENGATISATK